MSEVRELPEALAEPVARVRAGWMSLLFFANIALWLGVYAPIQVLLPKQAEILDAAGKEAVFSLVTGIGALVALIANPAVGLLSDRTCSVRGRRHPWTAAGAVVAAAGLLVLAFAPNIAVMVLGWCLVQAGLNGMLAMLVSAIADRVPVPQRAQVGGLVGIAQMLGTVLGAVVVVVLLDVAGLPLGYAVCAAIVLAGAAAFVLRTPDARLPVAFRPSVRTRDVLANLWISPRKHPDFAWAWGCHFMINLGNAFGTLYLLFFLKDAVRYEDPDTGLLIMMGLYGAALIVGALIAGHFSDKSGRRKPYVLAASVVMAVAALLLVIWQNWTAALVASPLLGIGFGAYMAVALAMLTQVLPAAQDRAKDLGVINIANSLPQVVAPMLTAPILAYLGGYPSLFAASALSTVLAAVLVTRVKTVS
ncbi:MFS transporter [Amycolatopsis regifaucium]|uniref:MFS transporter n=1 Tax=Amycolatopsis regifaucium TaxID=546365 RepID=A0A154MQP7_9PSEU|nr:MFS transporter [Amycolatopsis regifaucium]KZB86420.1 MFS transporter [Amycolatopsis regifaucium]OKA06389.1 MFS transporter [Amycolatopsis regifaucium]SFJ29330.1 Predicted arabinose efflux permease, MFS family [Amycolatopsis regifaucium]